MLEARNITVELGGRVALDGVSLTANRGELLGVVGPAASGKTVLLKTLCALHTPVSGAVVLDDLDLAKLNSKQLSAVRARLGFSFQNLALFDNQTTVGNVEFGLLRRGVKGKEARALGLTQLKAVGLEGAEAKLPYELSGGMRRRLALARAMVTRPEIALFDDPFVGLDPVACARIARLIARDHFESAGLTIVAAGDPAPLFDVADRILLLEAGRIVANLPAKEFRRSHDPAVVRYLGGEAA